MEEYNDLVEGKKVTPEKVKKYFKQAFEYVKGVSDHYAEYESNKESAVIGSSTKKANPSKIENPFFKDKSTMDTWYKKKDK